MLRAPIWTTSACAWTASACWASRSSVTTGRPVLARASDEAERLAAADRAAVDVDDRRLLVVQLRGRELVRARDRHHAVDAAHALEAELGDALGVADRPDRRRELAGHDDDVHAGGLEAGGDGLDLGGRGVRRHDDHHGA